MLSQGGPALSGPTYHPWPAQAIFLSVKHSSFMGSLGSSLFLLMLHVSKLNIHVWLLFEGLPVAWSALAIALILAILIQLFLSWADTSVMESMIHLQFWEAENAGGTANVAVSVLNRSPSASSSSLSSSSLLVVSRFGEPMWELWGKEPMGRSPSSTSWTHITKIPAGVLLLHFHLVVLYTT